MLKEGKVIGTMTNWDMMAIKTMEKVISLDGYMFCGKEEHNHCGKHMDGYFEMGYLDGEKIWRGNSAFRARYAPVKFDSVSYKVSLA